jgi:hypothetical protein
MPKTPWSEPSGDSFAGLAKERLRGVPDVTIGVRQIDQAVATPASFLVDIAWPGGGVLCEVADSIEGVRVMDEDGEDVSVESALRYITARAAGASRKDAWRSAGA